MVSTVDTVSRPMDFFTLRELGRTFQSAQQRTFDALTCTRNLKPFIADTSPNSRSTYLLRLNPTQKLLAAAHGDRSISIYCAVTGCLLARCMGHERSPWTISFHPSQPYLLASGCLGGGLRIWNLECLADNMLHPQPVRNISYTTQWKHAGAIASLAFHPVHPILAVAWTQEVVFYDWVSGRKLSVWRFVSNQSRVRWLRFNPDGTLLYTATANPSMSNHSETNVQINTSCAPDAFCSSNETSPAATPTKPVHETPLDDAQPFPSGIPRDMLLEFLVSQSDSWFQRLGVCITCSVRLCRWAGTLRREFPSTTVDVRRGLYVARRVADLAGTTMKLAGAPISRLIQELSSLPGSRSDVSERILLDVNPAAVAIIEDMPVREFLLSRGRYCSTPSIVADSGLCCGGHACDLVLTHRELMRHSICRLCLAAFWRWASRFVNWWCWSRESDDSPMQPELGMELSDREHSQTRTITFAESDSDEPVQSPNHSAGICIQCRARMGSHQKQAAEDRSCQVANNTPDLETSATARHSLPLAALDLLRSRLSNANEVTPVTYMASDLIVEGKLANYIRQTLNAPAPTTLSFMHMPALIVRLLQHATLAHSENATDSPKLKRRKLNEDAISISPPVGVSGPQSRCSASGADPGKTVHGVRDLTQEAAELARLLSSSTTDASWNRPRPVRLVKQCQRVDSFPTSQLFPYATLGSQLLRPTSSTTACSQPLSHSGLESTSDGECKFGSGESRTVDISTDIVPTTDSVSLTACCRCGRIVPQTFPIDPQSSLSAVVCEQLVLSDDHCHSAARDTYALSKPREWASSLSNVTSMPCRRIEHALPRPAHTVQSGEGGLSFPNGNSTSSTQRSNSVMYLINRTNADSMLNAVHRSINQVIAGLFVDMGEHGSATCLQDTTYRVCCWELNLCGPVCHSSPDCSPLNRHTDGRPNRGPVLPMPANVAVSYNTNSLVIPHVRLFNDSSICLSPDGRMLAAFVIPSATRNERTGSQNVTDRFSTSTDTLLAVYRLQPKQHRGHCLFARRFTTTSPVCLDFSPLGDYLAVGMATTRLPSVPLPSSSLRRLSANVSSAHGELPSVGGLEDLDGLESTAPSLVPLRHTSVAQIFRLDRQLQRIDNQEKPRTLVTWTLKEVASVIHPMLLNPVSCSRKFAKGGHSVSTSPDSLDRWHRLLLSASTGISLNTIVWNPNGGLFYGTTKGLVVLMGAQPLPLDGSEQPKEHSLLSTPEENRSVVVHTPALADSSLSHSV
ncbi:hypothetical protein CSKR_100974 [Clonorchis sinensis]|uniref:Uncharacterized protein n=1 Tax=Clonorchis sinensis TaxID=79923 RepID=A0A3R7FKP7_CLOSI|nr:hypothetical protein CSKR_100974 [Clonorchis sinensis]